MWIEELTIKGYGGLKDFGLEPAEGLNVILGPSQSGKSTVANCILDLLLGPGRWRAAGHGPQGASAKPETGHRFYARVRYRTEKGGSRLLQRDFDRTICRVQDEAGAVLDLEDGRAPGVALPSFCRLPREAGSGEPLDPARWHGEAASWRHRADRVRLQEDSSRLEALEALFRQEQELEGRLQEPGNTAVSKEDLRALLDGRRRLAALEGEAETHRRRLEELRGPLDEVSARMEGLRGFEGLTAEEVESVRAMQPTETGARRVDETRRTLDGFIAQEEQISRRLEVLAPAFAPIDGEADFDLALSRLERELGRSESLATRRSELDRLKGLAQGHSSRALAFMAGGAVGGVLAVAAAYRTAMLFSGTSAALLGIGIATSLACLGLVFREKRLGQDVARTIESTQEDVARLEGQVSKVRGVVTDLLARAGVKGIHELRGLHREYSSLQRDLETTRGYRAELEREIGSSAGDGPGGSRGMGILERCGVKPASDEGLPGAVATFLERYAQSQALLAERQGYEKTARDLTSTLEGVLGEAEQLRHEQDRLLGGALGEKGVGAAIDDLVGHGSRIEAVMGELQEVRSRIAALGPADPEALKASVENLRAQIEEELRAHEAWRSLEIEAEAREGYLRHASEASEKALEQARRLEAARTEVSPQVAKALDRAAQGLAEAWKRILGMPVGIRIMRDAVEDDVVLVPPAGLRIEVSRGEGSPWTAPAVLGRTAALLEGLLPGEMQDQDGGGNLPIFLENPFVSLNDARREKGVDWLLRLAAHRQVFLLTSEAGDVATLKKMLPERRWTTREKREGSLDLLMATPPARREPGVRPT